MLWEEKKNNNLKKPKKGIESQNKAGTYQSLAGKNQKGDLFVKFHNKKAMDKQTQRSLCTLLSPDPKTGKGPIALLVDCDPAQIKALH
ncbi:3286_t:CDS:2 [Ambispora gerdemannii]|uniref:3286_t:CDS:1 n=1 Tax=Ambispora gerdemannii TaxID=144530 RepID=A0A9N8ZEB3_9GLOM|nr:3286_t:CDS:2 [Ambispora gerdemannii]